MRNAPVCVFTQRSLLQDKSKLINRTTHNILCVKRACKRTRCGRALFSVWVLKDIINRTTRQTFENGRRPCPRTASPGPTGSMGRSHQCAYKIITQHNHSCVDYGWEMGRCPKVVGGWREYDADWKKRSNWLLIAHRKQRARTGPRASIVQCPYAYLKNARTYGGRVVHVCVRVTEWQCARELRTISLMKMYLFACVRVCVWVHCRGVCKSSSRRRGFISYTNITRAHTSFILPKFIKVGQEQSIWYGLYGFLLKLMCVFLLFNYLHMQSTQQYGVLVCAVKIILLDDFMANYMKRYTW